MNPADLTIVGVDCATDPRKTGVVAIRRGPGRARIVSASLGDASDTVADVVQAAGGDGPLLLCLDAPLGWPAALGPTLAPHVAGAGLAVGEPNRLFRRATDEFVRRRLGKQPLEVGADRIARTACVALGLLETLRHRRGEAIPLAWSPQVSASAAIEVYPAAVLLSRGLPASRYKPVAARALRERILDGLASELDAGEHADILLSKSDVLDAALAGVAGVDFLADRCSGPTDAALARSEGWIWFRDAADGQPPETT